MGMIEEAALEHPERADHENRQTVLHGLAMRVKWVLPYVLAAGAIVAAAIAIGVIATSFTEDNAPFVQTLLFLVAPVLSVLAVTAAMNPQRSTWMLALVGTVGLLAAGSAHLTWYAMVDERLPPGLAGIWTSLVVAAVVLIGSAVGMVVGRRLMRTSSWLSSFLRGAMVGAASGLAITFALFAPLCAPAAAIAALTVVAVLHRRSRRQHIAMAYVGSDWAPAARWPPLG